MSDKLGPIYGVPLLDSLPLTDGGIRQAMPSRSDLESIRHRSERVAAGYEVLLAHYRESQSQLAAAEQRIERLTQQVKLLHDATIILRRVIHEPGAIARALAGDEAVRLINQAALTESEATNGPK